MIIRVTYLNGNSFDITADGWIVEGPVLRCSSFIAPLIHISHWEEIPLENTTAAPSNLQ